MERSKWGAETLLCLFSYMINKQIIHHHFSSNISEAYLVFLGIYLSMPSSCQDFHTLHADD